MNDKPQPAAFVGAFSVSREATRPPTAEQPAAADEDGFDEPLNIPCREICALNIWKQILVLGGSCSDNDHAQSIRASANMLGSNRKG